MNYELDRSRVKHEFPSKRNQFQNELERCYDIVHHLMWVHRCVCDILFLHWLICKKKNNNKKKPHPIKDVCVYKQFKCSAAAQSM